MVRIKRVYEKPGRADGFRVLVDRLWPRGLTKKKAKINIWLKDVAPTNELRKWFGHEPKKWPAFQKKYRAELKHNKEALSALKAAVKKEKRVTLVFAAKDEARNNAVVLKKLLR